MIHGWRVIAGWGAWLCALALLELIFTPSAIELSLLGGAGAGMMVIGALTLYGERRHGRPRPEGDEPTSLPETSAPSVFLALGIATFVAGSEFGSWLVAIGAGIAALAIGGLVREWRAQQRP